MFAIDSSLKVSLHILDGSEDKMYRLESQVFKWCQADDLEKKMIAPWPIINAKVICKSPWCASARAAEV